MAKLYNGRSQYVGPGIGKALHVGPGKVHSLIATADGEVGGVILYDGVDTFAPVLFRAVITQYAPLVIFWRPEMPLKFENGLYMMVAGEGYVMVEA